jgi:transposase
MNLEQALQRIAELEAENTSLRARLSEIERQLGLNSQTSSKPPSSDGYGKPSRRTQSLRKKSKRTGGGQPGHEGDTLAQVSNPDEILVHPAPADCPLCGSALSPIPVSSILTRQVFDLPPLRLVVSEHQVERKQCPNCQQPVEGTFPSGVNAPTQYGTRIRAIAAYLSHQQFIPEARLSELLNDLLGCSFNCSTLSTLTAKLSQRLAPVTQMLAQRVKAAAVKHSDETGFRIGGKLQWLHVVSTPLDSWYRTAPTRKELESLSGIQGVVVHDHWKPYFQIPGVTHSLCNAHHLRELYALSTIEQESWATAMSRLLHLLCRTKHRYPEGIPEGMQQRISQLYRAIVSRAMAWHEAQDPVPHQSGRGRPKRRVGHNLAIRLQTFEADVLRCLWQPEVPFTNNQAERDLRMMKLKQKISGGFRVATSASDFACIRSVLSTARKRGLNLLQVLESALRGDQVLLD